VTTTADDGSAGSLRGAINQANAAGGSETVTLGAGLFKLTQFSTADTSTAGDLDVTCDLTVLGQSAATTIIDGGGTDRVFDIKSILNVSFQNLTIQNGLAEGEKGAGVGATGGSLNFVNVNLENNFSTSDGGGISTTSGNITLTNCSLFGNHAVKDGGAIFTSKGAITISNSTLQLNTAGSSGGAVELDGGTATMTITNSSVNNNRSGRYAGAIADFSHGALSISKAVIINNVCANSGGAIEASGSLTIDSSNVGFNTAQFGGGGAIYAVDSQTLVQITNSNLSADKATDGSGGAVETDAKTVTFANDILVSNVANNDLGGAIYEDNTTVLFSVSDSTINNNVAESSGGGIYANGSVTLSNSVVNFNVASGGSGGALHNKEGSTITATNTTVFQNTARGVGGGIYTDNSTGTFTNDNISNNASESDGGGLDFDGATLTLTGTSISNNSAEAGGGLFASLLTTATITGGSFNGNIAIGTTTTGAQGGAMVLDGTASITNATIHNNTAHSSGGGIYFDGSSLTVASSNISNNVSADANGGGIYDDVSGTLILLGDFISGNTAANSQGGGVYVDASLFSDLSGTTAVGNTITQNTAESGGGIYIEAAHVTFNASLISGNRASNGGGVYTSFSGHATLTNDTFAANTATQLGGGVYEDFGSLTLVNDTLNLNAAAFGSAVWGENGTTALGDTLAANVPLAPGNGTLFGGLGLSSLGHNLSTDKSGTFLAAAGDQTNITNPKLGPLQDNGGPTFTFALVPGSAAIDAGDDSLGGLTPSVDQRGVLRPQSGGSGLGDHVDIGAFEYAQLSQLLVTGPNNGSSPAVNVYNPPTAGTPQLSYSPITVSGFSNGARVALGAVSNDGIPDVIVGSGPGQAPTVNVYDGKTGALIHTFPVLQSTFTGGIYVAAGDFQSQECIVVGADAGGGPRVQVINASTGAIVYDFFAFPSNFTGGVRVGVADVNGDGQDDIICGAGGQVGSSAQVLVLDGTNPSHVLQSYSPFGTSFTGGIYVAGGSFNNGSIYGDVVAGEGSFGSTVKVYDGQTQLQLQSFNAFPSTFTGGVRVGTLQDINGDNGSEIIVGQGPGGSNEVNVVEGSSPTTVIDSFFAYSTSVTNGVFVGGA
jgi:predicted outer membrane repeat protein